MATVIRGSLLVAIVGVLVSGAVAVAVSETKIGTISEQMESCQIEIAEHRQTISEIECTLSGMSADIRWLVVTMDDIREMMYMRVEE